MILTKQNNIWKKIKPYVKNLNNWNKIDSIYIKENNNWIMVYKGLDILLIPKNFNIYSGLKNVIPISILLDGFIDEYSNNEDPLILESIFNLVGGTGIISGLNIEFTSIYEPGEISSFEFIVKNSINKTKVGIAHLLNESIPDIICNPDTFDLQQNETLLLDKNILLNNDIDYVVGNNSTLSIIDILDPVGGTLSVNGNNISFLSTGLAGQPAGFKYKVKNNYNVEQFGNVFLNITPLPKSEALIYLNSLDANNTVSNFSPPTMQDIFNNWGRFNGDKYYINKDAAISANDTNAQAWEFLNNPDRISMPLNVSPINGFISPDKLDNYTFECTVTSTSTDDDANGLVIAFVRDNNINKSLVLWRTNGGTAPVNGFGIAYYENGTLVNLINDINVGGVYKNSKYNGWNNRQSRLKILRSGDIIECYCTNWDDVNNYQVSSKLTLDLNSQTFLNIFKGKCSYGYATFSQPNSTYLNPVIKGSLNYNQIIDSETGKVWEYIDGIWVDTGKTIQQVLGYIREVKNPLTGETFLIKEHTIEYLGIT